MPVFFFFLKCTGTQQAVVITNRVIHSREIGRCSARSSFSKTNRKHVPRCSVSMNTRAFSPVDKRSVHSQALSRNYARPVKKEMLGCCGPRERKTSLRAIKRFYSPRSRVIRQITQSSLKLIAGSMGRSCFRVTR